MARPNLRQLEVFSLLMQTGSASETAKRLHVTQPAVSKTLSNLEALVGLQLFRRERGRLIPSVDAERIHADVERVFGLMASLAGSLAGLRSARHGHLAVAAIPALAAAVVGRCAGRFQETRPGVRMSVSALMTGATVVAVSRYQAELGFIHGAPSAPDVEGEAIGESQAVCVMHRLHPLAARESLSPRDLRGEPLVFLDAGLPPSPLILERFAQAGVVPRVSLDTNMSLVARAVVQGGRSVAVIDATVAQTDRHPDLAVVAFRPRVALPIYCIRSARRPLSPLAQQFADAVRSGLTAAPGVGPSPRRTASRTP